MLTALLCWLDISVIIVLLMVVRPCVAVVAVWAPVFVLALAIGVLFLPIAAVTHVARRR